MRGPNMSYCAFENIQYTMRELMHTMERYADMVETLEEKENV